PSTVATRPSIAGNAPTTSWSMRPNVAPTWSATPAHAGAAVNRSSSRPTATVARSGSEDDGWLVNTEHRSERVTDLAKSHREAHRLQDRRQQVVAATGRPVYRVERTPRPVGVPALAQAIQPLGHRRPDGRIHLEEVGGRRLVDRELVDTDHDA